ncbi:hypothetical protein ADIWIN_4048 [Winogradskyella psychrotolerans RS-3]|uniref:Uncharacterized protein n=2 Tax=Winogradskyella TaxID=286104 RepID=S7X0X4_9FLAO|nr:hypothetical protein ADIWIN_4048 [Winogradskyella psychrotolerans RS-3]
MLNSCATIFNGRHTKVNIYAPQNTTVELENSSILIDKGKAKIFPERSKDSLRFTLKNDSISSDFTFKRKVSGLLYGNLFIPATLGVGLLIDLTNQKRFTYKRHMLFEIDSTTNEFKISKEKIIDFKQHTTFIYTSPLLAIDLFSQPMISLGFEYFPLKNFSISAEYATIYTKKLRDDSNFKLVKNKGRSFRYEVKYYNLISLIDNPRVNEYIGLEARFIRQYYNKNISYDRTNQDINYYINEPIAVQKSVDIVNLKYGLNFPIGKRMFIDLYSGFGIRNKTFKNPNLAYNPETDRLSDHYEDSHFIIIENAYLEGRDDTTEFNFALGFKFGIIF